MNAVMCKVSIWVSIRLLHTKGCFFIYLFFPEVCQTQQARACWGVHKLGAIGPETKSGTRVDCEKKEGGINVDLKTTRHLYVCLLLEMVASSWTSWWEAMMLIGLWKDLSGENCCWTEVVWNTVLETLLMWPGLFWEKWQDLGLIWMDESRDYS